MSDAVAMQVTAAFALDLALGDPPRLPHPVRAVGRAAGRLEVRLERRLGRTRLAGVLLVLAVTGGTYAGAWASLAAARLAAPGLETLVSVYLLFTCIAVRDLAREAGGVFRALSAGRVERARARVSRLVGRDTHALDERGIARAAVESVAESTVDGVASPLFYAAIGGAPLALAFKAVSTLDSMVGYRSPRHRHFGWAAARLDDALSFVPARLCRFLFPLAATACGLRAGACLRVAWRDGRRHPSPNAGIAEAAFAGALGVQLGGWSTYGGRREWRPRVGAPERPLEAEDIRRAVRLMVATSALVLAALVAARGLAAGRG